MNDTPPRRLLVNFARIGDLVIMVPLLRLLAKNASLDVLTRPFGPPLFEGQNFIREAIPLAHPNRGRRGIAKLLLSHHRRRLGRELARRRYNEILLLSEERPLIRDWVEEWRGPAQLRMVDYSLGHPDRLRRGLESLSIGVEGELVPVLDVGDQERAQAAARLEVLGKWVLAVQVGSSPTTVPWPKQQRNLKGLSTEQWTGLLTSILDGGEVDSVIFLGVAAETGYVRAIQRDLPVNHRQRTHDWTGRTALSEVRALLTGVEALVSVDTGTAHLAAAVGCPVLVFFGPSDPEAYTPRGRAPIETLVGSAPCQFCLGTPVFKTCTNNVCMQSLGVQHLVTAWQRLRSHPALARTW